MGVYAMYHMVLLISFASLTAHNRQAGRKDSVPVLGQSGHIWRKERGGDAQSRRLLTDAGSASTEAAAMLIFSLNKRFSPLSLSLSSLPAPPAREHTAAAVGLLSLE